MFREEEYIVDKWLVEPKAKKPVTDPGGVKSKKVIKKMVNSASPSWGPRLKRVVIVAPK